MKKILSLFALFSVAFSFGQTTTTIDFDTLTNWIQGSGGITSYQSDHSYVDGVFSATCSNGLQNSTSVTDGFPGALGSKSWRIRNTANEVWTANIASGGVGTFSVKIRRWDANPDPVSTLDYSIDGGTTWIHVDTIDNATLGSSDFMNFSGTINSTVANIKVRILKIGVGERLMIDDFVWTDYLTASCNIAATGLANLTCNDAGTGSVAADDYLTFDLDPTGTLLGTTYTVSVSSGTITPTTGTYGAAASFQLQAGSAGAGNVAVTLSDDGTMGCSTMDSIMDPGACSSANPLITVTPSSLTNFDHNVGTPSAEQTFTAGGIALTADISLTAPTGFEISLTTGAGFTNTLTLPQVAGVVSPTTIYARGNSAAYGAFNGSIVASSTGAANDTVLVSGFADDYVYSTIDLISTIDSVGVAVSLNQLVELTGVVHCMDFDGNNGYSMTIIDGSMEGINLFSFSDVSGYNAPLEGDSVRVFGEIGQFNGLLQVAADSIELLAQGVAIMTPTVVTTLDESTESQYIKMDNLTFVTPIATFPTGSTNIDVTDGTNTFTIRVDSDTDIPGAAAPQSTFSVTGVGGQFDNSSPYSSGYQLFPCSLASFVADCTTPSNAVTVTDSTTLMATATGTGITYQWIECSTNAPVAGATAQSFTATAAGSYAVIVMDGTCSDTSICIPLVANTQGLNENTLLNSINVYPNPSASGVFNYTMTSNVQSTITITDVAGRMISSNIESTKEGQIDLSNVSNGTYYVIFSNENNSVITRLIKQ